MSNQNKEPTGVAIEETFNVIESKDTEALLKSHQQTLDNLPAEASELDRQTILLDIASDHLALDQKQEAWQEAKSCFAVFLKHAEWQKAVEACDVMYQCDLDDSIIALANGIWLSVTFPVNPTTTIAMLQHIIDETPDNSDGAAVAAITAHYIADLRAEGEKAESLKFLATQMIATVAKRHSQVTDQEMLEFWIERMELKDPAIFLPKLAKMLEIIVADKWWFDRDELRQQIPDN
ncbi:MAG: hypothetical protein PVG75_09250 [Thioalkalispiraceae bacterium]|jgi:hypothetical protein